MNRWSHWQPFPNTQFGGYLFAPFGYGVYDLRNRQTGELVLFGRSKNVAYRMASLLPNPPGAGIRNNLEKRNYVQEHLFDIDYRTMPCVDELQAREEENKLRFSGKVYLFRT